MLSQALNADLVVPAFVFLRVGAMLALLPGFSAVYVPLQVRLLLALAVSVLVAPVIAPKLPAGMSEGSMLLLVINESLAGVFLGTLARIIVSALHGAGSLTATFASLANTLTNDPVAGEQSATLAGFFSLFGLLAVFVTDLHHLMLQAIVASYDVLPAGDALPAGDLAATAARLVADSFLLALQLAAPFLVVGLGYQFALGLMSRLMPQLSVFFVGIPIQIGLQIWVIVLTISGIVLVFLNQFSELMAGLALIPS
jgi:flagellar biosynthetic protein FliR